MKTNLTFSLGLGLAMLTAAPLAQAQTAPAPSTTPPAPVLGGHPHNNNGGRGAHNFEAMDTNHDGFVTLDEWKAAGRREERFNEIDVNHTGKITRADLMAYVLKMREQREQAGPANAGPNTGVTNQTAH